MPYSDDTEEQANERAQAMLAELASLYGEVPKPRAWRVDALLAALYALTTIVALVVAFSYDYLRLIPGPLIYVIVGGYAVGPAAKAALRYSQEASWGRAQREHLETMQVQLRQMPRAEMLTRLAAAVRRGTSITGVVRVVEDSSRSPARGVASGETDHDPQ